MRGKTAVAEERRSRSKAGDGIAAGLTRTRWTIIHVV
jgi:hypothetical protein